mmetsp:Transcript_18622/g.26278  ORF Transcript_18622/g.26278 Transcript_18622/m.26278 type:complete len:112 (-) Transcript_18622:826-1161(-)
MRFGGVALSLLTVLKSGSLQSKVWAETEQMFRRRTESGNNMYYTQEKMGYNTEAVKKIKDVELEDESYWARFVTEAQESMSISMTPSPTPYPGCTVDVSLQHNYKSVKKLS